MRNIQIVLSPALQSKLTAIAKAVSPWVDRRLILGALLGGGVAMTTYAVAVDGTQNFVPASSEQMNQAQSIISNDIKAATADCAQGKPGSVGGAIAAAVKAHTEMASIPVDTEQLFDVGDSCWGAATQIVDLSNSIPSLASITSAAQSALLKYAQKKICSASKKVTGLITDPINRGLEKVGNIEGISDINGLTNDGVSSVLTKIDPELGKEYRAAPGETYSLDTNTFNASQSSFGTTPPATTTTKPPSTSSGLLGRGSSTLDRLGNLF